MPIAALSADTCKALTSSLVLNDAISVAKELIDNALDARATSISVEVSSNTLDVIQVKDNGSGIGIEDRQLLCRRGCTSKIRTVEDLAALGGSFLGFRGEALASIAELSGDVVITTRVEGEVVGSTLKYAGEGKLISSASASHPVGTTIRIQNFLSKIPVRRQVAQKTTIKTLNGLRKLLQSYAFSKPTTRLALNVLKSKDDRHNWSFVPCSPNTSLKDVASKIIGQTLAAQCWDQTIVENSSNGGAARWTLNALLIDPTRDIEKASGVDRHFSVDCRGVNADKGIAAQLTKIYKQYLRSALQNDTTKSVPSKPFICLQVACPQNSYDVNVEPAKDDLLFYDPSELKQLFENLLKQTYGDIISDKRTSSNSHSGERSRGAKLTSFDLLLARKHTIEATSPAQAMSKLVSDKHAAASFTSASAMTGFNMYAGNGDELKREEIGKSDDDTEIEITNDKTTNNPWALVKMNILLSPKKTASPARPMNGINNQSQQSVISDDDRRPSPHRHLDLNVQLPSPVTSPCNTGSPYQNPGPPSQVMRRRGRRADDSDDETVSSPSSASPPKEPSFLDTWIQQSNDASQRMLEASKGRSSTVSASPSWSIDQAPGRQGGTSLSTSTSRNQQEQPGAIQQILGRAFKTPFKVPQRPTSHDQSSLEGSKEVCQANGPTQQEPGNSIMTTVTSSSQQDLADIMEFEKRKRATIVQQRQESLQRTARQSRLPGSNPDATSRLSQTAINLETISLQGLPSESELDSQFGSSTPTSRLEHPTPAKINNPHTNRYLAAIHCLDSPGGSDSDQRLESQNSHSDTQLIHKRDLPPVLRSDPRGYLIHQSTIKDKEQQKSADGRDINATDRLKHKLRRTITNKLPLERILAADATYNLTSEYETPAVDRLKAIIDAKKLADEYILTGKIHFSLADRANYEEEEVKRWQAAVGPMIDKAYISEAGIESADISDTNVPTGARPMTFELDLKKALEEHAAMFQS